MAVTKFLARDLTVQVAISAVYTHVGGVETITHAPSVVVADSTDFDSNGWAEHIATQRGATWTLAGFFLEDESSGARDPGQEALLAASRLTGAAAVVSIKLTFPGSGTVTYNATADFTGPHGGHNDLAKMQCVLQVTGQPVYTGVS